MRDVTREKSASSRVVAANRMRVFPKPEWKEPSIDPMYRFATFAARELKRLLLNC